MATDAASRVVRAEKLRGIYPILNDAPHALELARAVLDAGVRVVQYRAKGGVRLERVAALRELTRGCGALLILNDDWHAAIACDCDGVHLGPDDDGFDNVEPVRNAMGARLIGLSCGTFDEIERANQTDVDYLGIGSVFATLSKPDAGPPIGIAGLRDLTARSRFPVAAVGGIAPNNLAAVRRSGVAMAAVISAIASAPQPREAARELVQGWNAG